MVNVERKAKKPHESPSLFPELLTTVKRAGLVGEEKNAEVVYCVGTSRLLDRPLNLFVKGQSSSGKNYLVQKVLQLFPGESVREITSASDKAWHYLGDNLEHKVIYIQEESEAANTAHPTRLLISENKLVRLVTTKTGPEFRTKRYETKGPIACVSTTTQDRLAIDDETRHISIWVDESEEQTKKIIAGSLDAQHDLSEEELGTWREVQNMLAEQATVPIEIPDWFASEALLESIRGKDVRVRRYFPAFLQACRTVCLIRSLERGERNPGPRGKRLVTFEDFAVASLIFDSVFADSLRRPNDSDLDTRRDVERISVRKDGKPVRASELAQALNISADRAYARLRRAERAGTICRANAPSKTNLKLYLPAPFPRFLPDPAEVFHKMNGVPKEVSFVHPLTGERVVYSRQSRKE